MKTPIAGGTTMITDSMAMITDSTVLVAGYLEDGA